MSVKHSRKRSFKLKASRGGLNAEPTEPKYRPRWKDDVS